MDCMSPSRGPGSHFKTNVSDPTFITLPYDYKAMYGLWIRLLDFMSQG